MSAEPVSITAARAVLEGLLGAGVRDVVLCPGSRSAPLAYLLAAAEQAGSVRLHVRYDERSAAFLALGCGLADPEHPAAVVTTSGTAVANLLPAVLEAHHAGVPLILLTADRPHRLRGSWANQTSDRQPSLFAGLTRAAADVDLTDLDLVTNRDRLRGLGGQAAAASRAHTAPTLLRSTGDGRPGPVHLNLCFDDPLAPPPGTRVASPVPAVVPLPALGPAGPAADPPEPRTEQGQPTQQTEQCRVDPAGTVVIAGAGAGPAAREFAETAGLPLLAEPMSGACSGPTVVRGYRLVLGHPRFAGRIRRAVVFGRPTLSRPVIALLADPAVDVVQVGHPADPGPHREVLRCRSVAPAAAADPGWLAEWVAAGRHAGLALDDVIRRWPEPTGPALAARLGDDLGDEDVVVLAASNAVRDLDLVADELPAGALVLANRGLSGIDGTVSTAVGVAAATGRPTRLLIGDLALLHDVAGLTVPECEFDRLRLQILVLDDEGGGIFHLLEHGEHDGADGPFERVFGTDPEVDVKLLAAATLGQVMDYDPRIGPLPQVEQGVVLVHTAVPRSGLRPLHAAIREAVDAAVASAD